MLSRWSHDGRVIRFRLFALVYWRLGCRRRPDMKRQFAISRQHCNLVTSGWTFDAIRFGSRFEQTHRGALAAAFVAVQ